MKPSFLFFLLALVNLPTIGQEVIVEGYAFESDNRGFLNEVQFSIYPKGDEEVIQTVFSDLEGFFSVRLPADRIFTITAEKDLFHPTTQDISTGNAQNGKVFAKFQLNRKPGYLFDVTLAEERADQDSVVQGISGARIEVYNNTSKEPELELQNFPYPNFNFTFQQGNHYTILIRKKGYFSKRLEAYVNVENCILCFDGLASIESVTDNLTEGHEMGSLLANIELKRADIGSDFMIENIFYDFNRADIRADAALELNKLLGVLKDNPSIKVELGSHTDSRGDDDYNYDLSQRRAQNAVGYLVRQGVNPLRITAQGYGERELTNRCANGIDCSESEHQQNRRTVIKVTGYLDGDDMQKKTLEDIKREEQFEELLLEVQNQEVVQVSSDQELPEEIKNSLPQEEMNAEEVEQEHRSIDPGESIVKTQKETTVNVNKQLVRDAKHPDPQLAMIEAESLPDKILEIGKPEVKSIELRSIPSGYNGFMIEIYRSAVPLGTGHYVRRSFADLYLEQTKPSSFSYLLGDFQSIEDALIYFEDEIEERFPRAKILEYKQGKRQ